eukprot:11664116-Heterocapsa_arctica.AAC.1
MKWSRPVSGPSGRLCYRRLVARTTEALSNWMQPEWARWSASLARCPWVPAKGREMKKKTQWTSTRPKVPAVTLAP